MPPHTLRIKDEKGYDRLHQAISLPTFISFRKSYRSNLFAKTTLSALSAAIHDGR